MRLETEQPAPVSWLIFQSTGALSPEEACKPTATRLRRGGIHRQAVEDRDTPDAHDRLGRGPAGPLRQPREAPGQDGAAAVDAVSVRPDEMDKSIGHPALERPLRVRV